jgi:hypothetical protein
MKTDTQQPDTMEVPVKVPGQCQHGRGLRVHCRECEASFRRRVSTERGTLDEWDRLRGLPALGIVPDRLRQAQQRRTPRSEA